MKAYIPFVQSERDCEILTRFYSDAFAARVSVESCAKTLSKLPAGPKKWIDAGVDALHHAKLSSDYEQYLKQYDRFEELRAAGFYAKPQENIVDAFVRSVLTACTQLKADWVSVPQLPYVQGSERNKINRMMAECCGQWKVASGFKGKLILPIIFTHQEQIRLKSTRSKKIALAKECHSASVADGIWVVESTLSDQEGAGPFETRRFPALISLHDELGSAIQTDTSVAGPYWGMNLVLWARGLVSYAAIGLGNSYQYHIPGTVIKGAKKRVALPPLRRWAIASTPLRGWLEKAVQKIPPTDPYYSEFSNILKQWDRLSLDGRAQIAGFYKSWFDKIASVPAPGTALALFQDLTSAYVLGTTLQDLPAAEGAGRKPWKVARQFMLSCLSA